MLQTHEQHLTIAILERLGILAAYKDAYYMIANRPLTIFCDKMATVKDASKADLNVLDSVKTLLSKT